MSKIAEQKALENYPKSNFDRVEKSRKWKRQCFEKGYEEAMQDFIHKAVQWLDDNVMDYTYDNRAYVNRTQLLEDFRKAIEK